MAVHYARGDKKPKIKDTKTDIDITLELSARIIIKLKKYLIWVSEVLLKGGVRLKNDDHALFADDLGILHESAPMK